MTDVGDLRSDGAAPPGRAATALRDDLVAAAQRCRDRLPAGDSWGPHDVRDLAHVSVELDEEFCRDVADRYEQAPAGDDDGLARTYERAAHEAVHQFDAVVAAGVDVQPWRDGGQPYADAAELVRDVERTRILRVYLTECGHGPPGRSRHLRRHPLRTRSGITVAGAELRYNDLLRAVHDLFGHVMFPTGFGPVGELRAAFHHLALSSEDLRRVLFTEQVAQICWFYFGAHVRDRGGRLRRPGDAGYVPPRHRPYPEQKVVAADPADLATFRGMCRVKEPR